MLILYTLGYLLIFSTLYLMSVRAGLTIARSWASFSSWGWFLLWWLTYIFGFWLLRLVMTYAVPRLAGISPLESRARFRRLEENLRPPHLGWVYVAIEAILVVVFCILLFTGLGTLWLVFVVSVFMLVYGNITLTNWRTTRTSGAVTDLAAEAGPGAGQITLRWQNPSDPAFSGVSVQRLAGVPMESHHGEEIYRGFYESWCDDDCEPGGTYYYTVTSLGVHRMPGGRATTRAQAFPLPTDPTGVMAQAGEHEIELHWQRPESPAFREVVVQRRRDSFPQSVGDGERIYQGAQPWCRDSNLQSATVHYYRLFTIDRYGQASTGTTVEVATRASDVSDLRIRLERGRIHLSWVNPADPIPEVVIVRKVGADPESRNDGDGVVYEGRDVAWTDDNTLPATDYHYRVYTRYPRAVYSDGLCIHITTPPPSPRIQDFVAVSGRNRAQLQWCRPAEPQFAGVLILRTLNRQANSPGEADASFVYEGSEHEQILDVDLEPNTLYYYTAFSYDEARRYGASCFITLRTLPGPRPVQFHPPQIDETAREVVLNWTRVDPTAPQVHLRRWDDQPPASLRYREPGGNLLYQGPGMQYVDRNLLTNHTYYYVVYALDDEGCASAGASQQVQTPEDWNVQVFIHFQAVGEAESYSLPESTRIDVWVPELLRITGQPPGTNFRLFNLTRNYEYRLDSSLRDQDTRTGDELLLTYDLEPNEGLAPDAGQGDNP